MRSLVLFSLALAACGDQGLAVHNNAPAVTLLEPIEGAEYTEADAIFLEGVVDDDSPFSSLAVDWLSSASGMLEQDTEVQADGTVRFVTQLEPGTHTIVLRAVDADSENGEDTATITVIPVPQKPSIDIDHPDTLGKEKGLEDNPFIFMASVNDHQTPIEDLTVELMATPYGLVCTMSPDGAGTAQCPATLPLGGYQLTFTVTDGDGNSAVANAPYAVVTRGDYDMDGDGHTPNGGDCNDSAPTVYPGADEVCDGLDNDCIDATAIDVGTDCYDDDGDGFCEEPPCVNTSATLGDCDDTDPTRYPNPAIQETINGVDDNCDGRVDEGTVVYDDDGDGYCETPPCVNASSSQSDCDDHDGEVNPGKSEICSDGVDNDCDGQTNSEGAIGCSDFYYDFDGDGYGISGATECWCDSGNHPYTGQNTNDCYDTNANAHPGQSTYFTNDRGDSSYDYDCDGTEAYELEGTYSSCSWSFEPFSCSIGGEGWESSEPDCGDSDTYVDDCDGSYDVVCILLCSQAPAMCTSCWSCDPDDSTETQACR